MKIYISDLQEMPQQIFSTLNLVKLIWLKWKWDTTQDWTARVQEVADQRRRAGIKERGWEDSKTCFNLLEWLCQQTGLIPKTTPHLPNTHILSSFFLDVANHNSNSELSHHRAVSCLWHLNFSHQTFNFLFHFYLSMHLNMCYCILLPSFNWPTLLNFPRIKVGLDYIKLIWVQRMQPYLNLIYK